MDWLTTTWLLAGPFVTFILGARVAAAETKRANDRNRELHAQNGWLWRVLADREEALERAEATLAAMREMVPTGGGQS